MRLRKITKNQKGQNIIEYAMVASIVAATVIAMSVYVFRSVQATQQAIHAEFKEFND
jgi:Flp pilus assembly pilin Flp